MKQLIITLSILFICTSSFCQHCSGEERWTIKSLNDPDTAFINFHPIKKNVSDLVKIHNPQPGTYDPRQRAEKHVYQVRAKVTFFKKENGADGDGDIHIVLQDLDYPSATMVAEMPDPDCPNVKLSPYIKLYRKVRSKFLSMNKSDIIGHVFTFTGVSFFDFPHRQKGLAKNCIELHPILYFQ